MKKSVLFTVNWYGMKLDPKDSMFQWDEDFQVFHTKCTVENNVATWDKKI